MSSRLPTLTEREVLSVLLRNGWVIHHLKGAHHQLMHPEKPGKKVTVSVHPGDMPRWILRRVLAQADLTEDEFRQLLQE